MIALLSAVVPQIEEIIYPEERKSLYYKVDEGTNNKRLTGGDKEMLTAAFRNFFSSISTVISPVVVLLDDLQWADSSSLDAIRAIITDSEISGICMVGCYRSNEVDESHLLSKQIRDLKIYVGGEQSESSRYLEHSSSGLSIIEIRVGNLNIESINEMLCELLSKDPEDAISLAKIVHDRTQGNIYFVRSFLRMLVEKEYLKFHLGTFQWNWNITTIESETSATQNLVELIQNDLRSNIEVLQLLKLASCLGNTFSSKILWLIYKNYNKSPEFDKFQSLLEYATQERFLIPTTNTKDLSDLKEPAVGKRPQPSINSASWIFLRFIHDKIQEAVLSLTMEEELISMQQKVGLILLQNLSEQEKDNMLFVIAGLLNNSLKDKKDGEIAELNLLAALKANDVAAFSNVVSFVEKGLGNLPEDPWISHFDLALQLFSVGARAEQSRGNCEKAKEYCEAVMKQEKASPLQKSSVYKIMVDIAHNSGNFQQSLDQCLEYLEELGCKFPRNPLVRKVCSRMYVRKTCRELPTVETLRQMPMMKDQRILVVLSLLENAGSSAYLTSNIDLYLMIRCRSFRLITKYGLMDEAGAAFASLASALMHTGSGKGGIKFAKETAELSLVIQDSLPSERFRSRVLLTSNVYIFGWTQPLQCRLKFFLEGYRLAMRFGSTFSATNNLMHYGYASWAAGTTLGILEEDLRIYVPQINQLGVTICYVYLLPLQQSVLNLTRKEEGSKFILDGEIMQEDDLIDKHRSLLYGVIPRFQCILRVYFEEYVGAADKVCEIGCLTYLQKNYPGVGFGAEYIAFGVASFAAARSTRQARYKRNAYQVRSRVQHLVENGCVNFVHVLTILDAEHYALRGKTKLARKSFSQAVIEAARAGFLQNAAVASVRYGNYLLEQKEREEARMRFEDGIRFYTDWGAVAVAKFLHEKHKTLLGTN